MNGKRWYIETEKLWPKKCSIGKSAATQATQYKHQQTLEHARTHAPIHTDSVGVEGGGASPYTCETQTGEMEMIQLMKTRKMCTGYSYTNTLTAQHTGWVQRKSAAKKKQWIVLTTVRWEKAKKKYWVLGNVFSEKINDRERERASEKILSFCLFFVIVVVVDDFFVDFSPNKMIHTENEDVRV